jgi:hypothetical protein
MQCARYRVRFGTLQSCVKEGIGCCLLLATCHRHQPIPTVQTARPCLYRAHPTNHTHSHVLGPGFWNAIACIRRRDQDFVSRLADPTHRIFRWVLAEELERCGPCGAREAKSRLDVPREMGNGLERDVSGRSTFKIARAG